MTPELKAALERAALHDSRSLASLVEYVLRREMTDRGFLRPLPPPTPTTTPARKKTR